MGLFVFIIPPLDQRPVLLFIVCCVAPDSYRDVYVLITIEHIVAVNPPRSLTAQSNVRSPLQGGDGRLSINIHSFGLCISSKFHASPQKKHDLMSQRSGHPLPGGAADYNYKELFGRGGFYASRNVTHLPSQHAYHVFAVQAAAHRSSSHILQPTMQSLLPLLPLYSPPTSHQSVKILHPMSPILFALSHLSQQRFPMYA